MNETDDNALTDRIRQHLEASTRELDSDAMRRLRLARAAAAEHLADRMRRRAALGWWMPAGAFATAVLAVIALMLWRADNLSAPPAETAVAAVEDIDLLTDEKDAEIARDMEFYQWLEVVDETG